LRWNVTQEPAILPPEPREVGSTVRIENAIVLGALVAAVSFTGPVLAESKPVGPQKCEECHKLETEVWHNTAHYKGFKEIEQNPIAKDVLAAAGGSSVMKRNHTCQLCHFTVAEGRINYGVSCESCHGPASAWFELHNDYGGVEKEKETPGHRDERLRLAAQSGMKNSSMWYEVAQNCNECHGLANPDLDADTLGKLLDAGHPAEHDWEYVQWALGSIKHRFYPVPTGTENKDISAGDKARYYVIGAAAKLASATRVLEKSTNPKFKDAQKKRAETATKILKKFEKLPEVKEMLAHPTDENGKKLATAVKAAKDEDLVAMAGELPKADK
jgi:hypothetical protein